MRYFLRIFLSNSDKSGSGWKSGCNPLFHALTIVFCLSLACPCVPCIYAQTSIVPAAGNGLTTATAYQITELGNLVWLGERAAANETTGKYYQLMNNIDASDTANWNDPGTTSDTLDGFWPIGTYSNPDTSSFRGIFDGNGKKIFGLTINRPERDSVGLFGAIGSEGKVSNLTIDGGIITGSECIGGLTGKAYGATIGDCFSSCTVMGKNNIGGLSGEIEASTISDCSSSGPVTGAGQYLNIGGLIGSSKSSVITNSMASGTVTIQSADTDSCAGGLIGLNSGKVTSCSASSLVTSGVDVSTSSYIVGGLIGSNSGEIASCSATGAVKSEVSSLHAGGLIGSNSGKVTSCFASGTIIATKTSGGANWFAGGLIGSNDAPITHCFATGSITLTIRIKSGANLFAGGLVGQNSKTITGSYATGAIVNSGSYEFNSLGIGGLVGNNEGPLQSCYATGPVKQLLGYDYHGYVGGFVGQNKSAIANCYATGAVIGGWYASGLIGSNKGPVTNCFAIGSVWGGYSSGGLIGFNSNTTVTACYWNKGASGRGNSQGGLGVTGKTTAEMQQQATFQPSGGTGVTDWDFTSVWGIVEKQTYPYLRAFESPLSLFRLDVSIEGNGGVVLSPPGGVYAPGTTVTLTATAGTGAHFAGWLGAVTTQTGTSTTVVMDAHKGVSARFLTHYEIRTLAELQAVATGNLEGYYTLMNNIDASDTVTWNDPGTTTDTLEGFGPIGTYSNSNSDTNSFRGIFDGNGKKITGLTINRPSLDSVGLFGSVWTEGEIRNLTLEGGLVGGNSHHIFMGGLVGISRGAIKNCRVSCAVKGFSEYIGGLVGANSMGRVEDCIAAGPETGPGRYVGGLAGANWGLISGCMATGPVTNSLFFGNTGGLIGINSGEVSCCFAIGMVDGKGEGTGGLAGYNYEKGLISDCYACGAVTGGTFVGGLVGINEQESVLTNCFATGLVASDSSEAKLGGLIGTNIASTVIACYWDVETTSQTTSAGGAGAVGKTTAEMKEQVTFQPGGGRDWDFTFVWGIIEGKTYPFLQFAAPSCGLDVTAEGDGSVAVNPAGGTYLWGTVVTLIAQPGLGSRFVRWEGDVPTEEGTQPSLVLTLTTNRSICAVFERIPSLPVWLISQVEE